MNPSPNLDTLLRRQDSHWANLIASHCCARTVQARLNWLKGMPDNYGILVYPPMDQLKAMAWVFLGWAMEYPPLPLP